MGSQVAPSSVTCRSVCFFATDDARQIRNLRTPMVEADGGSVVVAASHRAIVLASRPRAPTPVAAVGLHVGCNGCCGPVPGSAVICPGAGGSTTTTHLAVGQRSVSYAVGAVSRSRGAGRTNGCPRFIGPGRSSSVLAAGLATTSGSASVPDAGKSQARLLGTNRSCEAGACPRPRSTEAPSLAQG